MSSSNFNIVMYSQDGRGLGRTTRTLKIAAYLVKQIPEASILLLTDLSLVGRLKIPERVDFVHLPEVVLENGRALTQNLTLGSSSVLKIRRKITRTAVKTFKPNWIIIDRDPLFLPDEVKRTFSFVRKRLPETRVAWALPDVLGDPELVCQEMRRLDVYKVLNRVAHEIWIFGVREIFNQEMAYRYPEELARKVRYLGYLQAPDAGSAALGTEGVLSSGKPFVLVAAGSGVRGYQLLDNYLKMLERSGQDWPFASVVVSGPMMDSTQKSDIKQRCEKLPDVEFHRFSKHLLQYVKQAELVITTGGFNLMCEVLSYQKNALFVPDSGNYNEHLFRSRLLNERGFAHLLSPDRLTPEALQKHIHQILRTSPGAQSPGRVLFQQNALENILARLKSGRTQSAGGKGSNGASAGHSSPTAMAEMGK
ncbi:MAG: hypothetical protein D6715_08580 [Calditrichaeota bacterium]|nr:MAG: hypothetical protein D6715_08580 [Calditrichota bacterium]